MLLLPPDRRWMLLLPHLPLLPRLPLLPVQYLLGLGAYLWPKLPLPQRMALGPVHRFVGAAVWVIGLAAMAAGLQVRRRYGGGTDAAR